MTEQAQMPPEDAIAMLLASKAPDVVAALGALDFGGLAALEQAERENGNRVTILRAIMAERAARLTGNPALQLGDDAIAFIASATHEMNRAYCEALGDSSQEAWDNAPDWQRASAIAGVRFHLADPDAPPSASHESWFAQKLADGWTFGAEKDVEAKTHPCMVPFHELPAAQQAKDFLFGKTIAIVAPLVMELEALRTSAQGRRERPLLNADPVPPRSDRSTGDSAAHIVAIALCSAGGTAEFTLPVDGKADFSVLGTLAIYQKHVLLEPELPAMAITQAVALDDAERVLARTNWPVATHAGGGREALYAPGSIAFTF